jgi:hypothetical protein
MVMPRWAKKASSRKYFKPGIFAATFAVLGASLLVFTSAAQPSYSIEAESSTNKIGNVTEITDADASGQKALQFQASPALPPGGTGPVTHGDQLAINNVGPWTLQGVTKGQEQLDTVAAPSRGYWRLDTPSEFVPNGAYIYNNNPANKGGTLAADTTIDGYIVPAGTKVVQFRDLSAADFYAGGATGTYLFRGIRSRQKLSGAGYFNDSQAGAYSVFVHYADMGSTGPADNQATDVIMKFLGGKDHRVLRSYLTYAATGIQPNTPGVEIIENIIDKITFYYGEAGPCGSGGSCTYHLNGISSEGMSNITPTRFKILRNSITVPSPDEAGHITPQTDCIALFGSNGGSYNDVLVEGNYLGGSGYVLYAAGERPGAQNVRFINNKITTKWWTNGGNFGAVTAQATWGSNGNIASGNVWADDFGGNGNGSTPTSSRQYPNGDGPRKGQVIFGN